MRCAFGPCDDQPMARTVLIVDDHAPFRALARALLQLEGFEVVGEAGEMVVEDAPAVTPSGRRPHPDHARQTPPAGAYRGYAMRLRLGRARRLGGLVGARQPGQGR
jgi:hypothetical protein